jgi:hypothetical protein
MQEGTTFTEGTNHAICKLWPPLTTCQPGLAWKPPMSTLAHRLAVIHPDIRMRWPERLGATPVPSTADVRTAPRHAPHTRPTVCKKISNRAARGGQALDHFVGRASFHSKMLRSTTKQVHGLCLVHQVPNYDFCCSNLSNSQEHAPSYESQSTNQL